MLFGHHDLPDEIICKILSLLGPLDVLRARLVSKRMGDITYDREVWRCLYANACLPRPPGPFLSQSTQVLERILVRSACLAESWTTRPMEVVSTSKIRLDSPSFMKPKLVCGRWIITCEQDNKIVSYEMTKTPLRQVIWEAERGETIQLWESHSVMSMEEESLYVAVSHTHTSPSRSLLQPLLLEFRVNVDSLEFSSSLDIPAGVSHSIMVPLGLNGPIIHVKYMNVLFDTRTRIFYAFPKFRKHLDGVDLQFLCPHRVLFSSSFIIVLNYTAVADCTIFQVFVPPAHPYPSPGRLCGLQLTHECCIPDIAPGFTLIRDSVVDPLTGSHHLKFLCSSVDDGQMDLRCLDFILPKSREDCVLPFSFKFHDIATLTGPYTLLDDHSQAHLHTATSRDGHVRGYVRFRDIIEKEYRYFVTKFTIDASRETCQAVVGELSMLDKDSPIARPTRTPCGFDGIRGRVWFGTEPEGCPSGAERYYMAHVVEIR